MSNEAKSEEIKYDSRLENYNTIMIMKNSGANIIPQKRNLIHEQDLQTQKKDLFKAFLAGDMNYIYEFDGETIKKRDIFLKEVYRLGFTMIGTMIGVNWFFWKSIAVNQAYTLHVKLPLFSLINIIPIGIFSYQGFKLYNKTEDFLYRKYILTNQLL